MVRGDFRQACLPRATRARRSGLDLVVQLYLGLLLSPDVVNVLLDCLVLKSVQDCVDGGRAEHEKLDEEDDNVEDSRRCVTRSLIRRRERLSLSVEAEDDDEQIVRTIQDDD